jgi:hypothetical protein
MDAVVSLMLTDTGMAMMGLITLPWDDEPGIPQKKGTTMQSTTQSKPAFFVATADIPELGIKKNNMVTVEESGRCTVAFELNAEHFTPSMVARLRQVHV